MHVCGVAQCVSCVVRVVSCVRFQWMYDCKLDEMRDPLESYKNLGEFFTRHLKEGVRPMGDGMVSPVDGRVLLFGEIKDEQVEQIKGTHAPPHTHHRTHTTAHTTAHAPPHTPPHTVSPVFFMVQDSPTSWSRCWAIRSCT